MTGCKTFKEYPFRVIRNNSANTFGLFWNLTK
jgi:hypothetical protein